ncbi:hypothetical protein GCM10009552_15700 [Rothia nasimurium]|uniref:MarR family transcriptional regulator n=1 Tax=Luteibacter anthropi TaxID=564369 RepID=A0A7X5ZIS7_9GAMM|nr:MarR family transcriptional regulator [Luteibacter anthropi]NII07233.1 MarR family transcriptional regulator [Luteibacter anthropi]
MNVIDDQMDMFAEAPMASRRRPVLVRAHVRRLETPAARANDSDTSHVAARKHTSTGQRQSNLQAVADLVSRMPGLTSWELSRFIELGRDTYHEIARRLPDAVTAGAVKKGVVRACTVTGNQSTTWWPV